MQDTKLVLIKFKVRGNLRFLSHAETTKVFQRACVRAGIKTAYSQGFNPRPRLSLPLPRSVGVEADEDLLCLRIHPEQGAVPRDPNELRATNHELQIKAGLSRQLPEGCELISVSVAPAACFRRHKFTPVEADAGADSSPLKQGVNASFQPCLATYVLTIRREYLNEKLKAGIKRLLESESLVLERRIDAKNLKLKSVDVRPFLKSIELGDRTIAVECRISPAGSIRVDEILKLLRLDYGMLAAPIKRTNIQWQEM